MHKDRNNGTWPELKAKRNNKVNETPLESVDVMHSHLDEEAIGSQKLKKDRAAKQLAHVKNVFKDMADYADK